MGSEMRTMNPSGIYLAVGLLLASPGECVTICEEEESCSCLENEVVCQGSDGEHLELSPSSLPEDTYSVSVSRFASVSIKTNSFSATPELGVIKMTDLDQLKLEEFIFSEQENDGFLESFSIENIGQLELRQESIYSDSMNFIFLGNTVGHVKTYGFSGSNNVFNFSNNHIEKMESNAISVAFLNGDISSNTFLAHSGTPLRDIGPEPVCMPEYSSYEYDAVVEYKKVVTPTFTFRANKFPKFDLLVLNMPGTRNVPLGDFKIGNNIVPCNCSLIKDLASVSYFPSEAEEGIDSHRGDEMFKKLFYSTSVCFDSSGLEWKLKRYAREKLELVKNENTGSLNLSCSA